MYPGTGLVSMGNVKISIHPALKIYMLVLINPQKMVQKYPSFQKQFNSNNIQIKEAYKSFLHV